MKRLSLLLLIPLLAYNYSFSQSLDAGIQLYEDGDYNRALQIFQQYDNATANLFSGKSYFGLGEFLKAKHFLNQVEKSSEEEFVESLYTLALADFQLRNYSLSLDRLYEITSIHGRSSVTSAAQNFYNQELKYLTLKQRFSAFNATQYDEVRLDLLDAGIGYIEYGAAWAMLSAYKNSLPQNARSGNRLSTIEAMLADSISYNQRYNPNSYPEAPNGISYNIGVALPQFDSNTEQYEISQGIYFGIQLAVERFNGENFGKKAFLSYYDTKSQVETIPSAANDLVWNKGVDAVIGPLFSEVAAKFTQYAELYEVPLLTPLANSDSLNNDLGYTFQFNPTFSVQGRKMAQYAYHNLRYDTVAVIAEKGSLGEPSAIAFRTEFLRLGGEIIKYEVHDLENQGYDIRQYLEFLNTGYNSTFTGHVDAIYAPFTGVAVSTLIGSLLTEIDAAGSDITILGSEEWATTGTQILGMQRNQIYYTQGFSLSPGVTGKEQFVSEFRLRFKTEPNRFAYIGYDTATTLLNTLRRVQNPGNLKKGLKKIKNQKGFIMDVDFNGGHINQAVKIKRLTN